MKSIIKITAVVAGLLLTSSMPAFAQIVNTPILSPGSVNQGQQQQQGQDQLQNQGQQLLDGSSHTLSVTSTGTPIPLGLPGFFNAYPNFVAPIAPKQVVVEGSAFRPRTISYDDAKGCAGSAKIKNYGRSRDSKTTSLTVLYVGLDKDIPTITDGKAFLGNIMASAEETPLEVVLCKAFVEAMDRGAAGVIVESAMKFRTTQWGIGFGGSAGASGMDASKINPYVAMAGAIGFGTGYSAVEAKGTVTVKLSLTYEDKPGAGKRASLEAPKYLVAPDSPVGETPVVPAAYVQQQGN